VRSTLSSLLIAIAAGCGGTDRSPQPAASPLIEPAEVDFARYTPCAVPPPKRVTVVNPGPEPVAVHGWRSSCRCVEVVSPLPDEIAPGGSFELRVALSPWGLPGPHGHDLWLEFGPPWGERRLPVRYVMDPEVVALAEDRRRSANPEGVVRFAAIDGTPFRIVGFDPPLPFEPTAHAGVEVLVRVCWETLDRLAEGDLAHRFGRHPDGRWRSLWFEAITDHPLCGRVSVGLSNDLPPESGGA
jgi:hypothetical protein